VAASDAGVNGGVAEEEDTAAAAMAALTRRDGKVNGDDGTLNTSSFNRRTENGGLSVPVRILSSVPSIVAATVPLVIGIIVIGVVAIDIVDVDNDDGVDSDGVVDNVDDGGLVAVEVGDGVVDGVNGVAGGCRRLSRIWLGLLDDDNGDGAIGVVICCYIHTNVQHR
jgi:hypothetical protein